MKITRVYTDSEGKSQFEDQGEIEFMITSEISEEIGQLSEKIKVNNMRLHRYDIGMEEDWHNPPLGKTYVIFLEGEQEIKVSDGTKRYFSYGDILLLDDLTGQGHYTRAIKKGVSIILT